LRSGLKRRRRGDGALPFPHYGVFPASAEIALGVTIGKVQQLIHISCGQDALRASSGGAGLQFDRHAQILCTLETIYTVSVHIKKKGHQMELDMTKQTAAAENASSSATAKTGRTKPEVSAGARATKQGSAKSAAVPTGQEKKKKTKRAASVATSAGEAAPEKPKKTKVVRDSFTMPEADYRLLAEIKERCLAGGKKVKKSELLRAGVNLLAAMPANRLLAVVAKLDAVKTGRPAKD
jgi:hypothetical protein